MILFLRFKRIKEAFLEINFRCIFCLIQILYIFYFKFSFLIFPGVKICNIPGNCCKFSYIYV